MIGSSDELDVGDAFAGVGAERVGELGWVAAERLEQRVLRVDLQAGPTPPGSRTSDGDRALDLGGVAADLAAGGVDEGADGRARRSGRFPMSTNQAFHASACAIVARSIRGPIEPIISGGPAGRGPRGSSSQSRAWYQRPSKSMAPSRSSVRMIVKASSKRAIRWSYG